DRLPDEAARRGLAQMITLLLPNARPEVRPLPPDEPDVPLSAVAIPEPLAAFSSAAPRERARTSRGKARIDLVAGFCNRHDGAADFVARPRDAGDISRVLEVCAAKGWACVPFGGGTSVVGGVDSALARRDRPAVVALDVGALAGVHEVDAESRLARVGAGT